jgi:hypothetical protein
LSYRIVPIGKEFTAKSVQALEQRLNTDWQQGWEFVFVFPVVQRTCIFIRNETYLLVLRSK